MRLFALLFLSFFTITTAFVANISANQLIIKPKTVQSNQYQNTLKKADLENKKIMLYFTSDWCVFCKKMESITLSDEVVKKNLKNYIIFKINVDKEPNLVRQYRVRTIPSYIIINKDEKILNSGTGYRDPQRFLDWFNYKFR